MFHQKNLQNYENLQGLYLAKKWLNMFEIFMTFKLNLLK